MAKKPGEQAAHRPFAALKALRLNSEVAGRPAKAAARRQAPERPASEAAAPQPDAALFAAAVAGAEPLVQGVRAPAEVRRARPTPPRPTDDALAVAELAALCAGSGPFDVHGSEEEFYGLAPGVNRVLLDALRRGQYAVQASIDLHGMVREEAHAAVARFVAEARCKNGATCVLIVTGRGRSSPGGLAVLREALPRWLSRAPIRPHVLAYATARAIDGGPGAFYVLLRRQGVPPFGASVPC